MKGKTITITTPANGSHRNSLAAFFVILILALVILPLISKAQNAGPAAGFAFDRFRLTLEDGWRTEAAGPFYYSQDAESNTLWAIPPFFSRLRQPEVESREYDFLYPLLTDTHYGQESRWQFFQLLSISSGQNPNGGDMKEFDVFPIYFQRRATDTNLNYTAFVPFYGTIKNRLFRDEIHFVMLPFYVESRKRDLVVDNYFWPFVDTHHATGLTGWQFWPFIGREHKDITTQTNGFGDVSVVGGHDHLFYLWPFYLWQNNGIGTDNPERFRASIPFFAIERSPQRDSTSVLWPLFTVTDDRERKLHEWEGPWPFVILAHGENEEITRFWPIFSQGHNATQENDSYLWPLYTYTRTHADPLDRSRMRIGYYLYSRVEEKNTATGAQKVRLDMWPFFTWHHELNGNERLQILAPLEPALPDNPGIERNWSPLWSFWRAEKNPRTGAASQSLLWNLYRGQTAPDERKVSVFFGLYQRQSDRESSRTKLFYFTVFQTPR